MHVGKQKIVRIHYIFIYIYIYDIHLVQHNIQSFFNLSDACSVQICSYPEAGLKSSSSNDAALYFEAAKDADQVFGSSVAQIQYENHVCHLPESPTQAGG